MDFDFHILNIGWKKTSDTYLPQMTVWNNSINERQHIPLHDFEFNFSRLSDRKCIGYFNDENEWEACPRNAILEKKSFERCYHCESMDGFKAAFMYNQEPSNERIRKYLEQPHFLYLAYFHPGLIKVGTAAKSRKFLRLIEQDALVYSHIAQVDNATDAKTLERAISQTFGITEFARASRKFNHIAQKPVFDYAKDELERSYQQIISDSRFTSQINIDFEPQSFIETVFYPSTQPDHISEPKELTGKFAGLRGRFLMLEQESVQQSMFDEHASYVAFNTKELVGSLLKNCQ